MSVSISNPIYPIIQPQKRFLIIIHIEIGIFYDYEREIYNKYEPEMYYIAIPSPKRFSTWRKKRKAPPRS